MKTQIFLTKTYVVLVVLLITACKNIFETGNECITKGLQSNSGHSQPKIESLKYLNQDGSINEEKQKNCDSSNTYILSNSYISTCMSTVFVVTDDPYIAEVLIYDAYGKKVHSSTQRFGYCGELNDPSLSVRGGVGSFLIWNLKDDYGRRVPSGTYTWEVVYSFGTQGFKRKVVYKQGYICSNNSNNCSLVPSE